MLVAVTGAAGLLGRHLLAALLARGSLSDRDGRPRTIGRIVNTSPGKFEATTARRLGFTADADLDRVVRAHLATGGAA